MPATQRIVKAIRGATCAESNTPEAIERAGRRLAEAIARLNQLEPGDIISALFTATPDLDAQWPAVGARQAGWQDVAILCAQEMAVPSPVRRCVRVLVHAYLPADRPVRHAYLDEAAALRPDRAGAADGHADLGAFDGSERS
ncbi:MAG TPA: chorismate mutase [Limnochordales bacterium]